MSRNKRTFEFFLLLYRLGVFISLISLSLSCSQEGDEQNSVVSTSQYENPTQLGRAESFSVQLGSTMALPVYLNMPKQENSFGLTLNANDIYLNIAHCATGFEKNNILFNGENLRMYTADRGCKIGIMEFQYNGEMFRIAAGQEFNYEESNLTLFESSSGKQFFVEVITQLPEILMPTTEVAFTIVQLDSGQQLNIQSLKPILRIINSRTEVTEGVDPQITFTIEKVSSPNSDFILNATLGGTITPDTDIEPASQNVIFPATDSTIDVSFNILDDLIPEDSKNMFLTLDTLGGLYFYGDYQLNLLDNDDTPPPNFDPIIWYKPESLQVGSIDMWEDSSTAGSTHNASQDRNRRKPVFSLSAVNGRNAAYFDGGNDFLEIANHQEINLGGPYESRIIALAFKTSDDITSRQVIYEQGGDTGGLSIYIDQGKLYFLAWNANTTDPQSTPWGPIYFSSAVESDTVYIAALRHSAASGSLSAYLQGQVLGEASGIGPLFAHSDPIGLGGADGKTLYHDGDDRRNFFKGYISEYIHYNSAISSELFQNLLDYLQEKYISAQVHMVNLSTSASQIAEESSNNISNTVTLNVSISEAQSEDLTIDFSIGGSATEGLDYEALSQYSVTIPAFSTSAQFTVNSIDDQIAEISENIIINLINPSLPSVEIGLGEAIINIVDNDSYTPPNGIGFWYRGDIGLQLDSSSRISTWLDQSGRSIDAVQINSTKRPLASGSINSIPAVSFSGNSMLEIPSHRQIDKKRSYSKKTIAFAFKTGSNISGNQIIFEQGDDVQGLNIHISQNNLYFNVWNFEGKRRQEPFQSVYLSQSANPDTIYTGAFIFDSDNGEISLYLNGAEKTSQTGVNELQKHEGGNAIGGINGHTVIFDNSILSDPSYFNGDIAEILYYDTLLQQNDLNDLVNHLLQKYQP